MAGARHTVHQKHQFAFLLPFLFSFATQAARLSVLLSVYDLRTSSCAVRHMGRPGKAGQFSENRYQLEGSHSFSAGNLRIWNTCGRNVKNEACMICLKILIEFSLKVPRFARDDGQSGTSRRTPSSPSANSRFLKPKHSYSASLIYFDTVS